MIYNGFNKIGSAKIISENSKIAKRTLEKYYTTVRVNERTDKSRYVLENHPSMWFG